MEKNAPGPVVKNRYSDEELEEFRQIILRKLQQALEDLQILTGLPINENAIAGTSQTREIIEFASESYARDENAMFISRIKSLITELEEALYRIGIKTYGICRVTGNLIPRDRLIRAPHATLSIEAKKLQPVNNAARRAQESIELVFDDPDLE